jgi:hypothetical protein
MHVPAHVVPHAPQCWVEVWRSAQTPLHNVNPAGQEGAHCPPSHTAHPPLGTAQRVHEAPQALASVFVSTHLSPHFVNPGRHSKSQTAAEHVALPWRGTGHFLEQPPQCWGEESRFTQAPLQLVDGGAQEGAQPALVQTSPAAQALPQAPQFAGVRSEVSQPACAVQSA